MAYKAKINIGNRTRENQMVIDVEAMKTFQINTWVNVTIFISCQAEL